MYYFLGDPIPRRMLPTEDVIEYYSSPSNRGYLSDPEQVAYQRLVLAQKFGYKLPTLQENEKLLLERKDPRQIFFGLHAGWLVNLTNKEVLKPKCEKLELFYNT